MNSFTKSTFDKIFKLLESHTTMISKNAQHVTSLFKNQREMLEEMTKLAERVKELETKVNSNLQA